MVRKEYRLVEKTMKIPILGTGLSGLVGSRVQDLLGDNFQFTDLSLATGVDISNIDDLDQSFKNSPASTVLHMAAKTDVDGCEDDKIYQEEGKAWLVNVIGTQNIIEAAKKYHKRIIYISSDFVFDGTKETYSEDDEVNPVNWYGVTKCEGEKLVQDSGLSYTILRLAYPYRSFFEPKTDFVRRIIRKIERKEKILALTDHIFTPTFIDDIAISLNLILQKELTGIFHVVGTGNLTPLGALGMISKIFKLNPHVSPITREVFFKDRAFRPFKLALKNDKIARLGIKMKTFEGGLREMYRQLNNK